MKIESKNTTKHNPEKTWSPSQQVKAIFFHLPSHNMQILFFLKLSWLSLDPLALLDTIQKVHKIKNKNSQVLVVISEIFSKALIVVAAHGKEKIMFIYRLLKIKDYLLQSSNICLNFELLGWSVCTLNSRTRQKSFKQISKSPFLNYEIIVVRGRKVT